MNFIMKGWVGVSISPPIHVQNPSVKFTWFCTTSHRASLKPCMSWQ